jgi:HEAT repeat protein
MSYRRPPEDPRSTAELVSLALRGEEEDENAWDAIHTLHWRGSREVLVAAERLVHSPLASERGRGADILGQLGLPERTFPEECFRLLVELLRRESEPAVLASATTALGHLRDPRAMPELVKLKAHPSAEVRFGVVSGLTGQEHPEAIAALIELSGDPDEEIRSWATFGLGDSIDTDTPELREALLRRLTDPNAEVRGEALLGLARRKDARVLEPIQEALSAPNVLVLVVEAAMELRDRRVHPFLIGLRDRPGEADDYFQGVLDKAIESYEAPHPGGE